MSQLHCAMILFSPNWPITRSYLASTYIFPFFISKNDLCEIKLWPNKHVVFVN